MTNSEWIVASRLLEERLRGFRRMPKFGFWRSDEWVAQCIYAETSAFRSGAFYIEAFALPLFIPTSHLYFDYGFRVGSRWEAVTEELVNEVCDSVPRLALIGSLSSLRAEAAHPRQDIRDAEMLLCISVLEGNQELFEEARLAASEYSRDGTWIDGVIDRCLHLIAVVQDGGLADGLKLLETTRERVLKLLVDP